MGIRDGEVPLFERRSVEKNSYVISYQLIVNRNFDPSVERRMVDFLRDERTWKFKQSKNVQPELLAFDRKPINDANIKGVVNEVISYVSR